MSQLYDISQSISDQQYIDLMKCVSSIHSELPEPAPTPLAPTGLTVVYTEGGSVQLLFKENHVLHRKEDLPAIIEYYRSGQIQKELWYKNNQLHREGNLPDS